MLETLHIRDFALIGDLVIPWRSGLNVLTGETGAGKSIIVDAMSLLLGERAARVYIRKGARQADIEALFDISTHDRLKQLLDKMELDSSQDELLIRRVISAEGKSRCFLNGSVVTLSLLTKLGDLLVDMHGQHEHQSLMHPEKHLSLLDEFAGLGAEVALVREGYQKLNRSISTLERLIAREASRDQRVGELAEELDLLEKADLKKGEEEEIRSRRNLIANSEKVHRMVSEAYDMLFAGETYQPPLVNTWDSIMRILGEVAAIDKTVNEQLREHEDFSFKFGELAAMLETYISKLEYDPAELEALEKRLATISKLKRRHACDSLEELIDLRDRMQDEYKSITGSSEKKLKLEREIEHLREEVGGTAFVLAHKRSEAANRLGKKIQVHLHELGMAKTRFVISITQEQTPTGLVRYKDKRWKLWSTGVDRVEFLFTANVGESPKPLKAIASGGEISRIMLAIRAILAEVDRVPVIIFDEIDAGVGASMGMPIAEKLAAVAGNQQVICVTHLPHIAAMADNHIVVDKVVESRRTHTIVNFPSGQERVREVARMLGGEAAGQISIKHAKELLALSRKNS